MAESSLPKMNMALNYAKGYTIFLVVLGHAIIPAIRGSSAAAMSIYIFIYSFHMFAFFFFSGYLFERNAYKYNNIGKFIGKKALKLMLPYLMLSLIAYAIVFAATHIGALSSLAAAAGFEKFRFAEAAVQILTWKNHIDVHLWYIYALFIIFVLNIFLRKVKPIYSLLIAIAISAAAALINFRGAYDTILTRAALYNVAFCCGRCFINFDEVRWKKKEVAVAAAVCFALLCGYTAVVYIHYMKYKTNDIYALTGLHIADVFIKYIAGAVGTLMLLLISRLTDGCPKWRKVPLLLNKYCYEIYLFHQPFIVAGSATLMFGMLGVNGFVAAFAACVIGVAIPIFIAKFITGKVPVLGLLLCGREIQKKEKRS